MKRAAAVLAGEAVVDTWPGGVTLDCKTRVVQTLVATMQYESRQPWRWNDPDYALHNQPVVGVSWYEAVAYAEWLKQTVGKPYRLPTEAEWERAARHTDGRIYPWGNEWDANKANGKETGWGRPTVIGCFPEGNAKCGAADMAGNVWEWCQTRWKDEKQKEYPLPYQPDDGRELLKGGDDATGNANFHPYL